MTAQIENNWIVVSIFYEKSHWQKLITQFLKPFVLSQRQKGSVGSLYMSFSTVRGEHIRFAFEYTETDIDNFAFEFNNRISNFLSIYTSPESSHDYKGKMIFMDYYNNSIQYNLFNADVDIDGAKKIRSIISEKMLDFFAEEVDESLMFTFALQFIMIFCNAWENTYRDNIYPFIRNMLNRNYNDQETNEFFMSYNDLFVYNKEIIIGIYNGVYENEIGDLSLKENYSKMLSEGRKEEMFTGESCLPLDKMLLQQMGFKQNIILAIYYIIHLCHCESSLDS